MREIEDGHVADGVAILVGNDADVGKVIEALQALGNPHFYDTLIRDGYIVSGFVLVIYGPHVMPNSLFLKVS